jgi:hypothetical protein
MPCHVMNCGCAKFACGSVAFLCPVCSREYSTRASLEIHLYGQHAGLSARERSKLLHSALQGQSTWAPAGTTDTSAPAVVETAQA